MSQTLNLSNFESPNLRETSQLNSDLAIGATTIPVSFSDDLEAGDFLYLSHLGAESGEVVIVSTITDAQTITVNAPGTTKPHARFEELTVLFGDKIKIYRAPNVNGLQPADNTFIYLDTINIDYDQQATPYIDDTGSSDYWYKYIYLNSSTNEETSLADSVAARGGGVGSYCSIAEIKEAASMTGNRWVPDSEFDKARKAAQDEVNGALIGLYTLPFTAPIPEKIADITARLAAGLFLTGKVASRYVNTIPRGEKLRDAARNDLMVLQQKKSVLVDSAGNSLAAEGVSGFAMYPDSSTDNLDFSQGGRAFNTTDRY